MKKQSIIIIILIIAMLVLGYILIKEKPGNINVYDGPTATPTHTIAVPDPMPCHNADGVEVECKG